MRAILHFVRITILGGVLFLTPIVVLGVILNKAYNAAGQIMQPLIGLIPTEVASRTAASAILASLGLALVCFSVGLFARTLWAQRIVNGLEASVLTKVPGYEYLKQAGASVLGAGEMAEHPVVLAQLGGAWRIGVQTDVVGEGLVAVFVPNSPNPSSGGVFLVAADRVRPAGVPLAAAMGALRRCGTGTGAFGAQLLMARPLSAMFLRAEFRDYSEFRVGARYDHARNLSSNMIANCVFAWAPVPRRHFPFAYGLTHMRRTASGKAKNGMTLLSFSAKPAQWRGSSMPLLCFWPRSC